MLLLVSLVAPACASRQPVPASQNFLSRSEVEALSSAYLQAGAAFEKGDQVVRTEALEAYHPSFQIPTTGVLVGEELYFIANSQLRSVGTDGKYLPPEQLQPVSILRVSVAR